MEELVQNPHERQLTEPSPDDGRGFDSRKVRRRFAAGWGPGFTDEMSCLLRTRLRLAILVMLVGLVIHFLRNVVRLGPAYDHRPLWLLFSGCEIAVIVSASGLLWSRRPLSMGNLRTLELTIFGSIAAFFAWLQVDTYHDGASRRVDF